MKFNIKKISGDASFREFYRLKKGKITSIIVLANRDKFKNLITYCLVNKILKKGGLKTPKLIKNNYEKNMIEISDLGDKSFHEFISKKRNKFRYYKSLIKLIIKIQKIKLKKVYYFEKYRVSFKNYSLINLHKESDLFFDWFLRYYSKNSKYKEIKKIIRQELNKIYKKLFFKNKILVHRDFHASNVMVKGKSFYLIDSQDAIVGNPLYDVASLIDDVRIKLPTYLQDKMLDFYYKNSKFNRENFEKLKNDFDILSVQRNLKILGIFVRLNIRDNKSYYIKYLPYTWRLIEKRLQNPVFKKLNYLLKKYVKVKNLKN